MCNLLLALFKKRAEGITNSINGASLSKFYIVSNKIKTSIKKPPFPEFKNEEKRVLTLAVDQLVPKTLILKEPFHI
jgi:hypothetical protein